MVNDDVKQERRRKVFLWHLRWERTSPCKNRLTAILILKSCLCPRIQTWAHTDRMRLLYHLSHHSCPQAGTFLSTFSESNYGATFLLILRTWRKFRQKLHCWALIFKSKIRNVVPQRGTSLRVTLLREEKTVHNLRQVLQPQLMEPKMTAWQPS